MGKREHLSYKAVCPGCGEDTLAVEELYDEIPGLGMAVLVSMFCPKCGVRAYHEIPLESRGIKKIEFRVSGGKDLSARVIRSPSGKILIPELGLELSPDPASRFCHKCRRCTAAFPRGRRAARGYHGGPEEGRGRIGGKEDKVGNGRIPALHDYNRGRPREQRYNTARVTLMQQPKPLLDPRSGLLCPQARQRA